MSAFTALNGGSPKLNESPTEAPRKSSASEERPRSSAAATQPRTTPDLPAIRSDNWRGQIVDRPARAVSHNADDEATELSHKRKRSGSFEQGRDDTIQEQTPDATPAGIQSDARNRRGSPQPNYRTYGEDGRDNEGAWPTQHALRDDRNGYESQPHSSTSPRDQNEDQIGETLRRATGQMDHNSDYGNTSPDAEDRSTHIYDSPYGSEHRGDSMLQHDPKKRKRNFSNRTKTGCLTCRKRKKKCDEQKPECKLPAILRAGVTTSLYYEY